MVRRKDLLWKHAEKIENGRFFICKFCRRRFSGGISRIKSHLSGETGRDIQICRKVPEAVKLEALQALPNFDVVIDTPTKRAKNVAASNNVLEGENISGKGQDKSTVNQKLAKFLMLHNICPDTIRSPFFIDFVKSVAEHGPGYELPSDLTLKSQLMPDITKEVEEYVQNVIKCSAQTGCTLMCSACPLNGAFVDIFAYTPIGVVCIGLSINSGDILCLEKAKPGPTNAIQVIINDNNDKANSTMDILRQEYPWIYQSRCATHGIGLLLQRIYNLSFVSNTIQVAKLIVLYIYKHKVNVPLRRVLRTYSSFETDVFELISLLEVESKLQALKESIATLSSDQGKPCNYEQAAKNFKDAILIDSIIHCKGFWSRGKMVEKLMQPLIQACYLVHDCHGYGPTSGYLYEMMERVQDAFEQFRDSNHTLYDDICRIFKEVRSDIIYPIHEAAAFLNPIYRCSEKFKENEKMKNGVDHILELLASAEERAVFMHQLLSYRNKDSNIFTAQAIEMLKKCHPRTWWECCGNDFPVLQKWAIRILNQPCSSSVCKQQYDQLRTRNNDEQIFMVNAMMMEMCKSLQAQTTKPIILDKLGLNRLGEACDDVDNLGYENHHLPYLDDMFINSIKNDPTSSWVDWLPEEENEFELVEVFLDTLFEEGIESSK